jgi:hypothetical protein
VQEPPAIIYTIDIFDPNDLENHGDVLKKLGQVSAGEYFQLREILKKANVCKKIAKDIRNRYTITYIPFHLASTGSIHHRVKVTAPRALAREINRPYPV